MTEFTETCTFSVSFPEGHEGKVIKSGKPAGKQRYRCKTCGKKFREPGEIQEGRRYPVQQVGADIGWYYDGLSYREVARIAARCFETEEPSESTIYPWVQGYTKGTLDALAVVKAHTGPEWVADEMMANIAGHKFWSWNVMDAKTHCIPSVHLTNKRDARQAAVVMRKAKKAAANAPYRIHTGRLPAYSKAIKAVFGAMSSTSRPMA